MASPQRCNDQGLSSDQCEVGTEDLDPPGTHLSSGIDTALSLLPSPLISAARAAATTVGNNTQSTLPFPISVDDLNELSTDLNLNSSDLELLLSDTQYLQLPDDLSSVHNVSLPMAFSGLPVLVESAQPLSPPHDPLQNPRPSLTASHANTATTASTVEKPALQSPPILPSSPETPIGRDASGDGKVVTNTALQKVSELSSFDNVAPSVMPPASAATPLNPTPGSKNASSPNTPRAKGKHNPSRRPQRGVQRKRQVSSRPAPQGKVSLLKIAPRTVASVTQEGQPAVAQRGSDASTPVPDTSGPNVADPSILVPPSSTNSATGQTISSLNRQKTIQNDAPTPTSSATPIVSTDQPAPGGTQEQVQRNEQPAVIDPLSINIASAHPGIIPFLHYQIHPSFLQQAHLPTFSGEAPPDLQALQLRSPASPVGRADSNASKNDQTLSPARPLSVPSSKLDASPASLAGQSIPQVPSTTLTNAALVHASPALNPTTNHPLAAGIPHISHRLLYDPGLFPYLGLQPFTYAPIVSTIPDFNVLSNSRNPVLAQSTTMSDAPVSSSPNAPDEPSDHFSKSEPYSVKSSKKLDDPELCGGPSTQNDAESNICKSSDDQDVSNLNITATKISDPGSQMSPISPVEKVIQGTAPENDSIIISVDGVQRKFYQQSAARLDRHPVLGRLQLTDRRPSFTASTSKADEVQGESADILNSESRKTEGSDAVHDSEDKIKEPSETNDENVQIDGTSNMGDPVKVSKNNSRNKGLKKRLVWTPELHERFVKAIESVGMNQAVPKTLVTIMNVEGLTTEHVKSHLQKYRNSLRKEDEEKKTNEIVCGVDLPVHATTVPNTGVGSEIQGTIFGCNTLGHVEQKQTDISSEVPIAPKTSSGFGLEVSTADQSRKERGNRSMSAVASNQKSLRLPDALNLSSIETGSLTRDGDKVMDGLRTEVHVSHAEAQNTPEVVVDTKDNGVDKKLGHNPNDHSVAEVNSPMSGGSNGQTQRELELELVKERTLKLQLQLQVMVHRTIALNRRFQQQRERERIDGAQEESGRSTRGYEPSEPPAPTDLDSNSEMPVTRDGDIAPTGRPKREVDPDNLKSVEGMGDSRHREKRRRIDSKDGGSDGDRALVQTELSALLSVQMEMSRNLEEARVLLDGHSVDR